MGWDTKSTRNRGYNEERAKERLPHVRQKYGRNKYSVKGFDNDALDAYPVITDGDNLREWWCKCQDLKGGQWRPVCTHKGAVELYRERGEQGTQVPTPASEDNSAPEPSESVPPPPSELSLVPEPDHVDWGEPALPEWLGEWRDHQQKAIYRVHHAFDRGAKVVFLDAPTGSGKTAIAEAVRRRLGGQAIYTCTTKTLQEQFLSDYEYSKVLKGRANYDAVSEWGGQSCKKCPCSPNRHCRAGEFCPGMGFHGQHIRRCPDDPCPYRNAKWDAVESDIAVLNLAYLLAETNFVDNSAFRNQRQLTIIDEADLLENIVMDFVEVRVSMKWQNKLNLQPPQVKTYDADSNDWLEWTRRALRLVSDYIRRKEAGIDALPDDEKMERQEELEKASGLKAALVRLRRDLDSDDEDVTKWVYTGYEDAEEGEAHPIIFKPVTVDQHAPDVLWSKGNKFLLMSASIISPGLMAESLGLDDDEWDVVYVPSTFPTIHRPIKLPLIAKMSYKNKERARPKMLRGVQGILKMHEGERALIHTHSYHLTRYLAWNIGGYVDKSGSGVWTTEFAGRQVYTYTNSYGRDEALKRYRETPGAALLAPSLDRGTDLPGDLCRVMAICKVPYPYLGDKQVNARLYGTRSGQTWYAIQAVRSIVQMTGRGVRSRDDFATTYILDRSFKRLYRRQKSYFPDWWREALDWSGEVARTIMRAA